MNAPFTPSPDDLALLSRVVQDVTRARRMSGADAEDFAQTVQLRLVERRYDIFERYAGRSSLRTYLVVVVQRMLLDWQNHEYGKWRPSAAATRMGVFAVELERLIERDACTPEEAIEQVRVKPGAPSVADLRRLAHSLPNRPRRRRICHEVLVDSRGVDFVDPVLATEDQRARAQARHALTNALLRLSDDDRELIVLRYQHQRSVQSLAERLRVEPKALYRRFDRVLRSLREGLGEHGITTSNAIRT